MLEKIFIKQNRWEMTKWMKRNRYSYPEDYKIFRIFLYLNYTGAIIAIPGLIFMIVFLTGLFFNYYTLTLWLVMLIGGLTITIFGNRMQIPILHKYLFIYVKDQSISVDFKVNEWIYNQKYFSTKAYKYGIIYSIILYFPLSLLFIFTMGLWLNILIVLFIAYVFMGLLLLTNLPILFANMNKYNYTNLNQPIIAFYSIFMSGSLTIAYGTLFAWILGILIIGIYWLIFFRIWKKLKDIVDNDVKKFLLSDIKNYLTIEKEINLKYWKWIQSRRYLIEDLINTGNLVNVELSNNKIFKKYKKN